MSCFLIQRPFLISETHANMHSHTVCRTVTIYIPDMLYINTIVTLTLTAKTCIIVSLYHLCITASHNQQSEVFN